MSRHQEARTLPQRQRDHCLREHGRLEPSCPGPIVERPASRAGRLVEITAYCESCARGWRFRISEGEAVADGVIEP